MQETWDILCLLLMIRINYHHQLIMNKRRIPCLDDYLDRINLTLWPRFKVCSTALQLQNVTTLSCTVRVCIRHPYIPCITTCKLIKFIWS